MAFGMGNRKVRVSRKNGASAASCAGCACAFGASWYHDRLMFSGKLRKGGDVMAKFAIVATIKTVPGKRDEYLKHLKAHGERCLATEPGTLKFDILVPQAQEQSDTVMLYEVYESPEAFQRHWTGPSIQQLKQEAGSLQASLSGVRCNLDD